jgi:ribosomal protein S27AE
MPDVEQNPSQPRAALHAQELKPCPRCGSRAELARDGTRRVPYRTYCKTCQFTTDWVSLEQIAIKLWKESRAGPILRAKQDR